MVHGECAFCTSAAVTHPTRCQPPFALLCVLQGRLFVTRDQKLAMRRDVGGSVYLLNTNDAAEQLAELSKHFSIK